MNYIVGGERKNQIIVETHDTARLLKINEDDYKITGTCDDDEFYLNINVCDDGTNHERVHVECVDNRFECELDIIPTSLDYMTIQNIDDFMNGERPIRPDNLHIDKMCSMKYIKTIDKIL